MHGIQVYCSANQCSITQQQQHSDAGCVCGPWHHCNGSLLSVCATMLEHWMGGGILVGEASWYDMHLWEGWTGIPTTSTRSGALRTTLLWLVYCPHFGCTLPPLHTHTHTHTKTLRLHCMWSGGWCTAEVSCVSHHSMTHWPAAPL